MARETSCGRRWRLTWSAGSIMCLLVLPTPARGWQRCDMESCRSGYGTGPRPSWKGREFDPLSSAPLARTKIGALMWARVVLQGVGDAESRQKGTIHLDYSA